ncbi:MAG: RNA pseudouridine synthase [Bacteroidales bacterium]|nr:RNA pseudouridine synthase [Bacteroidales bacterium]MCF8386328.1 RNA pseudouridine synthase [Bacteroidales bacterium]MCF8398205.1 RNA pseudouridine synthase [Bacteroidales bacterium]
MGFGKYSQKISAEDILHEDNHLLIINKYPTEIVQADKTGDIPLVDKVREYIKVRDNKPGNVFMGLVHRIDRPVSGALIFAKTGKALLRMSELLKEREIRKIYWAVVKNPPPRQSDHLLQYLRRNRKRNKSFAYNKEVRNSQKAELKYKLLAESDNYFLLEVELLTGRHHQIRVQLSSIGCPIKGDVKYGFDRTNEDASIHLHSRKLEFIHPVKKEKISIVAGIPHADNLWDHFQKVIAK